MSAPPTQPAGTFARAPQCDLVGDHSLNFPLLCAYADVPELHVVQLDAHLDFSDLCGEERYSAGSPEVDGLGYRQAAALVAATASRNRLVGADLVELAPTLDPSGRSALVAARALMDLFVAAREASAGAGRDAPTALADAIDAAAGRGRP